MASKRSSPSRIPAVHGPRLARKERRHADRRQLILRAARKLLVSQGIEHFSIASVAELADVSKPAVYYYFDSKEELVLELAAEVLREEHAVLRTAIQGMTAISDALVALIRTYVDYYVANLDSFRILYVWPQVLGLNSRTTSEAHPFNAPYLESLVEKLEHSLRVGVVRTAVQPREIVALAWLSAHAVVSIASSHGLFAGKSRPSIQEQRDAASRMIVERLAPIS